MLPSNQNRSVVIKKHICTTVQILELLQISTLKRPLALDCYSAFGFYFQSLDTMTIFFLIAFILEQYTPYIKCIFFMLS